MTGSVRFLSRPERTSGREESDGGGISLLHLSWGHPRRALPVILALWSPDFPHARAFALGARLLGLLGFMILPAACPVVNKD